MGLTKDMIEEHLLRNDQLNKMQAGFTLKRRIEDNLIILKECKEAAFKSKKKIIAIGYRKAYDSIKREQIVESLLKT